MADAHLVEFLTELLDDPQGRQKWLAHKLRLPLADLSSADFTGKDLRDYDMSDGLLSTAIFLAADLTGCDFSDCDLSFADLRRAVLRSCVLDRACLVSANLQYACLTDACLEEADLSGARLAHADLIGADLSGANLTGADLRGACLKYTRLTGAKLEGANVAEADLTGSVMDDDAPMQMKNFDSAIIDDRKYREMKSRLILSRALDIVVAQPAKDDTTETKSKRRIPKFKFKRSASDTDDSKVVSYTGAESDLSSEEGCYRILGLEFGTPLAGITKSFRQQAMKFHPDKVMHLGEGERGASSEQFRLARRAYEILTRMRAKPLTNLRWVASVPVRESPYDYTIEEYILLADANPRNVNVLYNLAWKYFDQGIMEEAIETYERVLAINPEDEDAEYNVRVVKLCKSFDLLPDPAADSSI